MPAYLKIENVGVCPPECFTVLGISLADTCTDSGIVGQFGSGSKKSIALLLRNQLNPIVFSGNLKMEFDVRDQLVEDSRASKTVGRVFVKYGGKTEFGTSKTGTEDLGFVVDDGRLDWDDPAMALREFVSNAIDRSIREHGNWDSVKVELVEEGSIRAKAGHTRIFVPCTPEVFEFYSNIGKWFLHFSEPESLKSSILPKANRNMGERKAAVIYRRGVRVREFMSSETDSLFDYNIDNLKIDECRKASDWDVKHACGLALANADKPVLTTLFHHMMASEKPAWELSFSTYDLQSVWNDTEATLLRRKRNWNEAFVAVAGDRAVLSDGASSNQLQKKGYEPIQAPEAFVQVAAEYGVNTPAKVLSQDELVGRELSPATPAAEQAVDFVWDRIVRVGLTNGTEKPEIRCFTSILDGGVALHGFYRDDTVFLNVDLCGGMSTHLTKVALEEIVHHITKATDNSRDFQDFLLCLLVRTSFDVDERGIRGSGEKYDRYVCNVCN